MKPTPPTDRVPDLADAVTQVHAGEPLRLGFPAGFWRRYGAALIDGLVLWLATMVVSIGVLLAIGLEALATPTGSLVASVVTTVVPLVGGWLYYAIGESRASGGTPGKLVSGVRVVGEDGGRIGFLRATGRYFAKILSAIPLGLGFVLAGLRKDKRALHDLVAGTHVVAYRASRFWLAFLLALLVVGVVTAGAGLYVWKVVLPGLASGAEEAFGEAMGGFESGAGESLDADEEAAFAAQTAWRSLARAEYEQLLDGARIAPPEGAALTATAGPAALGAMSVVPQEATEYSPASNQLTIAVKLPPLPNSDFDGALGLAVERVLTADGTNVLDAEAEAQSGGYLAEYPPRGGADGPHLYLERTVGLAPGVTLDALRTVEGTLTLRVPLEVATPSLSGTGATATFPGGWEAKLVAAEPGTVTVTWNGPWDTLAETTLRAADGSEISPYGYSSSSDGELQQTTLSFDGTVDRVDLVVVPAVLTRRYAVRLDASGGASQPPVVEVERRGAEGEAAAEGVDGVDAPPTDEVPSEVPPDTAPSATGDTAAPGDEATGSPLPDAPSTEAAPEAVPAGDAQPGAEAAAPPPPAPPKPPTLDELLDRAATLAAQGKLTSPKGDNAYELYRAVLRRSSKNVYAQQGIVRIQRTLLDQAEAARDAGRTKRARDLARRVSTIEPGDPELAERAAALLERLPAE